MPWASASRLMSSISCLRDLAERARLMPLLGPAAHHGAVAQRACRSRWPTASRGDAALALPDAEGVELVQDHFQLVGRASAMGWASMALPTGRKRTHGVVGPA